MAKGNDIQERLISFALASSSYQVLFRRTKRGSICLCSFFVPARRPLPTMVKRGRGEESRRDFIHKLGVVLKELNETIIWLEIIIRSSLLTEGVSGDLLREANELAKIISASIKTVQRRA